MIFAKGKEKDINNSMIYSILGALELSEQIELCQYEHSINLQRVEGHEVRLIQQAASMRLQVYGE